MVPFPSGRHRVKQAIKDASSKTLWLRLGNINVYPYMLYKDLTPVRRQFKKGNFPKWITLKPQTIFCEVYGGDVTHKKGWEVTHISPLSPCGLFNLTWQVFLNQVTWKLYGILRQLRLAGWDSDLLSSLTAHTPEMRMKPLLLGSLLTEKLILIERTHQLTILGFTNH